MSNAAEVMTENELTCTQRTQQALSTSTEHTRDGVPGEGTKTVQPGLPTTGLLVFEMPEAETSDMTLLLSSQYGPQLQDEIAIALDPKKIAVRDKAVIGNDGL